MITNTTAPTPTLEGRFQAWFGSPEAYRALIAPPKPADFDGTQADFALEHMIRTGFEAGSRVVFPLSVAQAREMNVCRICRQSTGMGSLQLDFGQEFAHTTCVERAEQAFREEMVAKWKARQRGG